MTHKGDRHHKIMVPYIIPQNITTNQCKTKAFQPRKINAVQNPFRPETAVPESNIKMIQAETKNDEDVLIERDLAVIFKKYDTKIIQVLSCILAKP